MKKTEIQVAQTIAMNMLKDAGLVLGRDETIEITDFGKDDYQHLGLGLVVRLNEKEYASKWLAILPGQTCPNHFHKFIKETFFVIKGDVQMTINNQKIEMGPGDKITLPVGTWHMFTSKAGAVIEEITTHQAPNDSYFEDPSIQRYVSIDD